MLLLHLSKTNSSLTVRIHFFSVFEERKRGGDECIDATEHADANDDLVKPTVLTRVCNDPHCLDGDREEDRCPHEYVVAEHIKVLGRLKTKHRKNPAPAIGEAFSYFYENSYLKDIKSKFDRYRYLINELAEKQGKGIDLGIGGDEVKVDINKCIKTDISEQTLPL